MGTFEPAKSMESGEVLALGNPCELRATRQKVKASAICFVLPSRLPLELGGEGSADMSMFVNI